MEKLMFDNSFSLETGGIKSNTLFDFNLGNSGIKLPVDFSGIGNANTGFNPEIYNPFDIVKPISTGFDLPNVDTYFGGNNSIINQPIFNPIFSPPQKNTITVSGVVKDENGTPLPNANVVPLGLDDKTIGAFTNFDGKYSLEVPKDTLLQVSYLGFLPVKDKANTTIKNFTLKETSESLDEIIVKTSLDKGKKDNTTLYIGIGAGILALVSLILIKNKNGNNAKKQGLRAAEVTI